MSNEKSLEQIYADVIATSPSKHLRECPNDSTHSKALEAVALHARNKTFREVEEELKRDRPIQAVRALIASELAKGTG